jgi:predicted acetyltransferase
MFCAEGVHPAFAERALYVSDMDRPVLERLELARPSVDLFPSYLELIEEMRSLGEKIWSSRLPVPAEAPEAFVARLLRSETAPEPPIPVSVFWATFDEHVVGRIALRHGLDDKTSEFGGHIDYEVRPSRRRQGIAAEMLRKLLATDRAREIGRVLVTCSPENIASRRTIESNHGVLAATVFSAEARRDTCQYWIVVDR